MPRRPDAAPPSYRLHKQSGQAIVSLPLGAGNYRDVLLGTFGTPESRAKYGRVLAEWEANGRNTLPSLAGDFTGLSVNELVLRFWRHVERHYRDPDGQPTKEVAEYRIALRFLRRLYGQSPVREFGPLALKAVREQMIAAKLSRGVVNQRTGRIKRAFRWGVENELVPPSVLHGLQAVRGLQRGRSEARETAAVKPVPPEHVEAVLQRLTPPIRAMIQLLRLTGMRPGECCVLRRCDIDESGTIWLYTPRRHKNAWRGMSRVVALGPKAQEIIRAFFKPEPETFLFSPRDAMMAFWQQQRRNRRSKVYPSQVSGREKKLTQLRDHYTVDRLSTAISRACRQANVPHWHPNQLRHLHATEVRRQFGIEGAGAALGHHRLDTTEIYAERNTELAKKIASQLG